MPYLGMTVERVAPGEVEVALVNRPELTQQLGALHGAFVTALADGAAGYAALTLMPADAEVVTVELKINFLRPALGERFVARGRVLKPGRTLSICQGDVYGVQDGRETHVATLVATMMRVANEAH
ncbi:MAG: PaaI family thioesterase [Gammaproteobacteria bacterium]|nr:PaaI family thioesterase [Gammaproteobacteria bacterium]MBI5615095.1 PaaI family thioesterase [Gammaproteobacteria bacterium]